MSSTLSDIPKVEENTTVGGTGTEKKKRQKRSNNEISSTNRPYKSQNDELKIQIAVLTNTNTHLMERLKEKESEIVNLKNQLTEAQHDYKQLSKSVDQRSSNMLEGVTHKIVNTAMQVLNKSVSHSLTRLQNSTSKLQMLMPPTIDASESKETFHKKVADYLKETVKDMETGEKLLKQLDDTINDCKKIVEEEKEALNKRIETKDMKPEDEKILKESIENQEQKLNNLEYERSMLFHGLQNEKIRQMQNKNKIVVVEPTVSSS